MKVWLLVLLFSLCLLGSKRGVAYVPGGHWRRFGLCTSGTVKVVWPVCLVGIGGGVAYVPVGW